MTKIVSTEFSKPHAKVVALNTLDAVRGYAKELYKRNPLVKLEYSIMELDELESRIKGNSNPLRTSLEVDAHFHQITHEIVNFSPQISTQLAQFWKAHLEVASMAESNSKPYIIMGYIDDNQKQILKVDERYHQVADRIRINQNDEITVYALFYVHILRTEIIEYNFLKQFREMLTDFELSQKYDAEEIFSANNKIRKGRGWKTDARAIRDALSHNKYELFFTDDDWKIHFKNNEEGYNYDKVFKKEDFFRFQSDTDILYRSTLMLVLDLISRTIIKQHLLQAPF